MVDELAGPKPEDMTCCGTSLASTEGWIWWHDRIWHKRIWLDIPPEPCGKSSDKTERRCDRCMKKAGLIW